MALNARKTDGSGLVIHRLSTVMIKSTLSPGDILSSRLLAFFAFLLHVSTTSAISTMSATPAPTLSIKIRPAKHYEFLLDNKDDAELASLSSSADQVTAGQGFSSALKDGLFRYFLSLICVTVCWFIWSRFTRQQNHLEKGCDQIIAAKATRRAVAVKVHRSRQERKRRESIKNTTRHRSPRSVSSIVSPHTSRFRHSTPSHPETKTVLFSPRKTSSCTHYIASWSRSATGASTPPIRKPGRLSFKARLSPRRLGATASVPRCGAVDPPECAFQSDSILEPAISPAKTAMWIDHTVAHANPDDSATAPTSRAKTPIRSRSTPVRRKSLIDTKLPYGSDLLELRDSWVKELDWFADLLTTQDNGATEAHLSEGGK